MDFWLIIFIAAFIGLTVVLPIVVTIRRVTLSAGDVGERAVARRLRRLPRNRYFIINDLMIEKKNGHTSQIDHVVVSPYGIFVIETKNISGYIYGSEYSQKWERHWKGYKRGGYYGSDDRPFDNPVLQNGAHVKALYEQLRNCNTRYVPIIAFSPQAELKVDVRGVDVVYWTQVKDVIKRYTEEVMSVTQAREIYEYLLSINIKDKARRRAHADNAQMYKNNYRKY